MAKDITILTHAELIELCKTRGREIGIQATTLANRRRENTELKNEIEAVYARDLSEKTTLETEVDMLRNKVKELAAGDGPECDCFDSWTSCGTCPETWDKLKRCDLCGKIGVR